VNLLLLVVGCFMDIMSAILIIAPMLAPMAMAMGVHPIHMAIIFIVNLEIGYLTPPVGLNLFVSSTLFKKSLGFVIRSILPTLVIMLGSLMVVTWVPNMSLGLLKLMEDDPAPLVGADRYSAGPTRHQQVAKRPQPAIGVSCLTGPQPRRRAGRNGPRTAR
jgi:C4-dicarboxylate transporter DctM subunit